MRSVLKKWGILSIILVMLYTVTGCQTKVEEQKSAVESDSEEVTSAVQTVEKAGTYAGAAKGYHGELKVSTELNSEGKIVSIVVDEHAETEGIGTLAIEKLTDQILESQSLNVDGVSGATLTSDGFVKAVAMSLETAELKASDYGYVPKVVEEDYPLPDVNRASMPEKVETTHSVTIKDVKGREVVIDLPISTYAISTMDVIEYVVPLKGEDAFNMLVGSGQDGGHGLNKYAEVYTPIVGNYMEHVGQISDHNAPFDLEMILAMSPDVLIVNSAMGAHKYAMEVEDQLAQAGIKIILIDVPGKQLETSAQQTLTLLGQIFEEEKRAEEVCEFLDEQFAIVTSKQLQNRVDKPTVYYEKSGYSEVYGSTSTSAKGWGMVIALAGGENIADALLMDTSASGSSSSTLDPEFVLKANPDYIIVSGINDGWLDITKSQKTCAYDIVNRTGWNELKAVQNGDLYEFAHSTSRQIYAFYPTLKMAKIFYPETFADVNPEAALETFFDRYMLVGTDISTWYYELEDGME